MLRSIATQSRESVESVLKKKRNFTDGCRKYYSDRLSLPVQAQCVLGQRLVDFSRPANDNLGPLRGGHFTLKAPWRGRLG